MRSPTLYGSSFVRFRPVRLGPVILLALLAPLPLSAQFITGRVTEEGTGRPIYGALITLEEEGGPVLDQTLSDVEGRYGFRLDRITTVRIRVDQIGIPTRVSGPITSMDRGTVEHDVALPSQVARLAEITVEGTGRCEVRPQAGAQTYEFWEEARKALEINRHVEGRRGLVYDVVQFTRIFDRSRNGEVALWSEELDRALSSRPLESRNVGDIADHGFAVTDPTGTTFFMPDAEVLLSDEFLDHHCMEAVRESPDEVGIRFQPVRNSGEVGLSGTFWLDAESGGLRRVAFQYVNLPSGFPEGSAEGEAGFERLPDGRWIVQDWRLSMPLLAPVRSESGVGRQGGWVGIREIGGRVEAVRVSRNETVWEVEESGIVTGVVFDSVSMAPLEGARVRLRGHIRSTRTASDGSFSLSDLPLGDQWIVVTHPARDSLRLKPLSEPVTISGERPVRVGVTTPARRTEIREICREPVRPTDGVLFYEVVDRATGELLPGATIHIAFRAPGESLVRTTLFYPSHPPVGHICHIPVDRSPGDEPEDRSPVRISVEYEGRQVEVQLPFLSQSRVGFVRIEVPKG